MNEYTRREEVRWTFIASLALVLFIAPAVILLVTAQGKLGPDPNARKAAEASAIKVTTAHGCLVAAEKLVAEIDVFKASAKAAHLDAPVEAADAGPKKPVKRVFGKPPPKEKEVDVGLAWPSALPSRNAAKQLKECRQSTEAATGVKADATPLWEAIEKAAKVAPSEDKNEQLDASRLLLKLLGETNFDKVVNATRDAETAAKAETAKLEEIADKATVREPIPDGIVPRRLAVGIGVGLSVIALLLSYLGVRVVSVRRLTTLIPLREAAKTTQPGLHAAAVLRLAAQSNGGLHGGVIGGALGGLVAAAVQPADTDLFIGGVMAGFLVGLGMQWMFRLALGATRWRARATELADIEKPAIPIVLVLSGVNPGLEAPFITFFTGLSEADAASTVEKLAAQAEEKILAAAEANRQQGQPMG